MSRYNVKITNVPKDFTSLKKGTRLKLKEADDPTLNFLEHPQIVSRMIPYLGKTVTISRIFVDGTNKIYIKLLEDDNRHNWILKWFK